MNNKKTIALIVGLLCVAFSVFGIIKATNSAFYKMPMFKLVLDEDEIDEASESFEKAIEEAEDATDEEIEEFEDETGKKWKHVIKCLKNPSLNNVISIGESLDEFDSSLDMEDTLEIIKVFRSVILIYGLLVALFSLLGVLLKKIVFPIIAIALSLGFYLAFVGVIFLILFIVLSIVHTVLISKSKELPQSNPAEC